MDNKTAEEILIMAIMKGKGKDDPGYTDNKCFVWPGDMEVLLDAGAEPIEVMEHEGGRYSFQVIYGDHWFISGAYSPSEIAQRILGEG